MPPFYSVTHSRGEVELSSEIQYRVSGRDVLALIHRGANVKPGPAPAVFVSSGGGGTQKRRKKKKKEAASYIVIAFSCNVVSR